MMKARGSGAAAVVLVLVAGLAGTPAMAASPAPPELERTPSHAAEAAAGGSRFPAEAWKEAKFVATSCKWLRQLPSGDSKFAYYRKIKYADGTWRNVRMTAIRGLVEQTAGAASFYVGTLTAD